MKIPTLVTKRLTLEPLSTRHSMGMFELWSSEEVSKHSGEVQDYDGNKIQTPVTKVEHSDLIIDFWVKAAKDGWGLRWAVILKEGTNCFVGIIGFNSLSKNFEIAFHLHPKYWKRGIMTEASKAIVNWSRKNEAIGIKACIERENKASVALAERLGMKPTGQHFGSAQEYKLNFLDS